MPSPLDSTPCLRLAALARELGLLIAVGLLERAPDGRVFITQMLCRPDGIHRFYRKTHLGGKEAGWISAGDRLPVFETAQGVIGMAVCYDTHYPALVETLSLKGAELVLAPFASPKDSLRRETWMKYLPARAYDNRVYLGCCNLVGGNGIGGHFSGGTVLFDPDGEVVCENFSQEETLADGPDFSCAAQSVSRGRAVGSALPLFPGRPPDRAVSIMGARSKRRAAEIFLRPALRLVYLTSTGCAGGQSNPFADRG